MATVYPPMIVSSTMSDALALGRRIRHLRREQGLTLADLSDLTGLTLNCIHNLEVGRQRNPRLDTLKKISKALHTSLVHLLEEEED